ncbi:hypothetical protein ACWD5V_29385 [Streptomyces sp. NPDC002523]
MISGRVTLTTGYVCADLRLPGPLPPPDAAHLLPGGWTVGPPTDTEHARIRVKFTDGPGHVTVTDDRITLHLTAKTAASAALAFTTYTALERARQQADMVTLHGTAATHSGRAVLILGHKSAGKTTTALALTRRGWTHAGDDLVILHQTCERLTVMPGKPTAPMRPPQTEGFYQPKPLLDLREAFQPVPVPLALIVRLTVHPHAQALTIPAVPFSSGELLRLTENLGRYISGLPTPVNGLTSTPHGPVWPIDTPACARWRSNLIRVMEEQRFFYLHAPTAADAADLIEGLMP